MKSFDDEIYGLSFLKEFYFYSHTTAQSNLQQVVLTS